MIPSYIDSHAHLFFADYAHDLAAVLTRAKEAGDGTRSESRVIAREGFYK